MITFGVILSAISLLGAGISIGMVRGAYLTRKEHAQICAAASAIIQKDRDKVWEKIDQIYDWMVTGVVQINRRDGK